MRFMITAIICADTICEFLSREQTCRLNDVALAVNPVRLNSIEPGTLAGQVESDDTHSCALLFDCAIMAPDPSADLFAEMPGCVVPDHDQSRLPQLVQFRTTPTQKLCGHYAHRTLLHEPQPHLLWQCVRSGRTRNQQAVTGKCLAVWIVLDGRLFHQTQCITLLTPSPQSGLCESTPPDLILETQSIFRMPGGEFNQAVAVSFFRAYAGSGLVIHCLARFQRTPSRCKAVRTASRLTRSGVNPCSKLTSAANSSVHRLVALPKSRGLWWSNARSCSAAALSNPRSIRCGFVEPGVNDDRPFRLNALIALRAVSVSHPNSAAICDARLPEALDSNIWQRRSVKASRERSPARKAASSFAVNVRT